MNWIVYLMSVSMGVKITLYTKAVVLAFAGIIVLVGSATDSKPFKTGMALLILAAVISLAASFAPLGKNMLESKSQYQALCE